MKNILYINETGKISGAENSLLCILKNISKKKYSIRLLLLENGDLKDLANDFVEEIKILNVPKVKKIHRRIFNIRVTNIFAVVFNIYLCMIIILEIRKYIIDNQINIVHTNSARLSYLCGGIAAKLTGVKVISHIRIYFTEGIIDNIILKIVENISDKIIAISNSVGEMFNSVNKLKIIFNAVDLDEFSKIKIKDEKLLRYKYRIPNNFSIVSIIGRITDDKGQDIFIEAANNVLKDITNVIFFIVGDSYTFIDNKFNTYLRELCIKHNIERNIKFIGFWFNMPQVYYESDIIVHCSKRKEPFGRVLIESLAMKTPIIASNMGGPLDIIENNKSGLLISPNNPELLANAILKLLNNKELSNRLIKKGERIVRQKFNIDTHINNIEKIYDEI